MKVQVLGSGCQNCKKLYEITREVVSEMDETPELEYVTGVEGSQQIIELGAMSSPVLTVDGKIAMVGFSSDKAKVKAAITNSHENQD